MGKAHYNEHQDSAIDFFKKDKLETTVVKNGIILPARAGDNRLWANGGVIDENGDFIEASGNIEKTFNAYAFGGKYDFDESEVVESDEEVVFFGPFVQHWGHFICDQIGRLWYIKNNPKKYKIAYCGWNWGQDNGDLYGNFLELLELLGCKKEQFINITKPTRFKKVIVPELAFWGGRYYTKEFEDMVDVIVKNALKDGPKSPEKIYFSRAKFNNGKERGEDKLEKIFAANGYEVLYPETLDVKSQITYFNQAKEIAMVAGSISHNLMFTRSKKVTAIILNKMNLVNNYQMAIDAMTKANIIYIDAYFNLRQVLFGMGPFLLSVTKYLKRFLKDRGYKIPKFTAPTPADINWYLKTYHKTYTTLNYKELLESQKKSLIAKRRQQKEQKKAS